MSAEDNIQAEQFGKGWTPDQQANMSSLTRSNAATKKALRGGPHFGKPGTPGLVIKAPSD